MTYIPVALTEDQAAAAIAACSTVADKAREMGPEFAAQADTLEGAAKEIMDSVVEVHGDNAKKRLSTLALLGHLSAKTFEKPGDCKP
jgi:hypothetical protein